MTDWDLEYRQGGFVRMRRMTYDEARQAADAGWITANAADPWLVEEGDGDQTRLWWFGSRDDAYSFLHGVAARLRHPA